MWLSLLLFRFILWDMWVCLPFIWPAMYNRQTLWHNLTALFLYPPPHTTQCRQPTQHLYSPGYCFGSCSGPHSGGHSGGTPVLQVHVTQVQTDTVTSFCSLHNIRKWWAPSMHLLTISMHAPQGYSSCLFVCLVWIFHTIMNWPRRLQRCKLLN